MYCRPTWNDETHNNVRSMRHLSIIPQVRTVTSFLEIVWNYNIIVVRTNFLSSRDKVEFAEQLQTCFSANEKIVSHTVWDPMVNKIHNMKKPEENNFSCRNLLLFSKSFSAPSIWYWFYCFQIITVFGMLNVLGTNLVSRYCQQTAAPVGCQTLNGTTTCYCDSNQCNNGYRRLSDVYSIVLTAAAACLLQLRIINGLLH